MSQQVLSVTKINEYIRTMMDRDCLLANVAVRGEISNYKKYPSGHHYFTLKDDTASLRCVMFKSNATRLRFCPENGMQVLAMGKISVYPRDGTYQLCCTAMAIDGVGDLYAAFEELKSRLAKQGLFDSSHKLPLPEYPGTIGIVTSSAGAAIHDMLRILRRRYPLSSVKLLPVRVQGREAPAEIAGAIRYANLYHMADLLIVGRGGGSIEDLWAFNDEVVAQAIFDSQIPIISAVGHEPDVTIADYVADLRAATPSNAAELAVPDQDALRQNLDAMLAAMSIAVTRQINVAKANLDILAGSTSLKGPNQYIVTLRNQLEHTEHRLCAALDQSTSQKRQQFVSLTAKLDAMNPLKVLTRGYSVSKTKQGTLLRSYHQVTVGNDIDVTISDAILNATITGIKELKNDGKSE